MCLKIGDQRYCIKCMCESLDIKEVHLIAHGFVVK